MPVLNRSTGVAAAFAILVLPALASEPAEQVGLANVKAFVLEHSSGLVSQTERLAAALSLYSDTIAAHGGDYAAAWSEEPARLAMQVGMVREVWLEASNQYETIEGIVAGIPETVKYDLILDAGNPGTESEDVAEYDLVLPDGAVLKQPGNLFHGITEPLIWGTGDPAKLEVDLDGDGAVEPGEVLFDANLGLGAANALVQWSTALDADIRAWAPNRDDAFTSVVVMTPTVGDYFGEWKESRFVAGDFAAFVAQSRLKDVAAIMGGCRKMYFEAVSPVVAQTNADLDIQIRGSFDELLALVSDTYGRETAGERFGIEEADALGSDAQLLADRIVALVLQAAAQNQVTIRA